MQNLSQDRSVEKADDRPDSTSSVVAIVCVAVALAGLDLFVVNVALGDIGRELGGDLSQLSWVLNGYAIAYASLLVLFGRIADRHARERGFLLGVALFIISSALCATAPTLAFLIGARVIQGAAAALMTPTSLSLLLTATPPDRRASAVRAWTAVGGLAAAIGPVVGGLLVAASWRWVFLINVPIGAAALVAGWRRLPHVPGHAGPRPDTVGAALVTGAVALISIALVEGSEWGWTSLATVTVVLIALLAGAAFVRRCLTHEHPLVEPALFRERGFTGASVSVTVYSGAFGAMLLSLVLWEQRVWGWSALRTGFAVAPGPLMVPLFSFVFVGPLIARWGGRAVATAGALVFAAGAGWWVATMTLEPNYLVGALPGTLLTGIGVGLTLPTLIVTATAALPAAISATGSGVINMLRQLGLAIGVALVVAVIGTPLAPHDALVAFRHGWLVTAGLALGSAVFSAALLGARRRAPSPEVTGLVVEPVGAP